MGKINWSFCIHTDSFSINLQPDSGIKSKSLRLRKDRGNVTLLCPPDIDFDDKTIQLWLEKVIIEQIRGYAKGILPAQLRALSAEFNLPFKEVHINAARTRWGSCVGRCKRSLFSTSVEYTINISLFTLLLPPELQRLVLLHELTHTLEMNHSPKFHQKLDAMLGGTEKQLNKELKQYRTDIFSFAQ